MKLLVLLIMMVSSLFSVEVSMLKMIKETADTIKSKDGETFGQALIGMARIESHFGRDKIGDAYEHKYYIIVNKKRIYVDSSKVTMVQGKRIYLYKGKPYNVRFYYDQSKPKKFTSLKYGLYHMGIEEAKISIEFTQVLYNKYKDYLNNDLWIMTQLLSNDKFATEVAAGYLVYNYEIAVKRKMWSPYRKAISRWNGGWYNVRYWRDVIKYRNYYVKKLRDSEE